mgnify:FL=1
MEQADYNKAIVSKLDTTQAKQRETKTKRQTKGKALYKIQAKGVTDKRNPKIDQTVIDGIAALVAKGLNETEACALLGVKPEAWFNWKVLHKHKYNDALSRIRAAKINSCLEAIDQAGDGRTIETATGETIVLARADWRAKAWMLERAVAPERFREQQQQASPLPAIAAEILSELSAKVFAKDRPEAVLDAQEVKALPAGDAGDKAQA